MSDQNVAKGGVNPYDSDSSDDNKAKKRSMALKKKNQERIARQRRSDELRKTLQGVAQLGKIPSTPEYTAGKVSSQEKGGGLKSTGLSDFNDTDHESSLVSAGYTNTSPHTFQNETSDRALARQLQIQEEELASDRVLAEALQEQDDHAYAASINAGQHGEHPINDKKIVDRKDPKGKDPKGKDPKGKDTDLFP